jgi:hypothetical protein
MIDKLAIIDEAISNIDFHISHAEHVRDNPDLYETPEGKQEVDVNQYLSDLNLKKQALEQERSSLD